MYHLRYNNIPVSAMDEYRHLLLVAIDTRDKELLPPEVEYDTKEAALASIDRLQAMLKMDGKYEVKDGECPYLSGLNIWNNGVHTLQ